MANVSEESRLVIASNLTVAGMLRDLIIYQTNEKPIKETDEYIYEKFRGIVDLLSVEDR